MVSLPSTPSNSRSRIPVIKIRENLRGSPHSQQSQVVAQFFLSPQLGEIPTIRKKLIITELTCEVFVNLIIIIKAVIVCLTETYLSRDAPIDVNGY